MAGNAGKPKLVNIDLLRYKFRFRPLFWREELAFRRDKDKGADPVRQYLSLALHDVSGLPVPSPGEGGKVISVIPEAILSRVWKVYRGSLPPARMFTTSDLYKAPDPSLHQYHVSEEEEAGDELHDHAIREMESKYGKQEVAEEAELSRMVLEAAQRDGRKLAPATPEGGTIASR